MRATAPPKMVLKRLAAFNLRRADAVPDVGGPDDLNRAAKILANAECFDGDSFLAFTGDKRFLWSNSGESFIMFGRWGRAWVAMGGPVGKMSEFEEMTAAFTSAARAARFWPAFYSVGPEVLDKLAVYGFVGEKVGERALVHLEPFSVSGKDKKDIRNAINRAEKSGCRFEIRPPGALGDLEPALRKISDAWLRPRTGVEKKFSLGQFDPDYLARFSLALVWRGDDPVAFANIRTKNDFVTMDLMRFLDEGPGGGMNYLFAKLLLWAKEKSYRIADLGLAPLAGLNDQTRPSTVSRLGAFVYSRGGRFYGFEGLRAFKDKFDPEWRSSFVAAPNHWRAGAAAIAVAALTGGGIRNMMRKTRKELGGVHG